jgi:hypothetical protein
MITAFSAVLCVEKRRCNAEVAKQKRGRAARLPAAAPTVRFSRISNLYFQYARLSRKNSKKISGTSVGLFQNLRGALYFGLYRDRSPNVAASHVLSLVRNRR